MNSSLANLTSQQLRRAAEIKEEIDALESELDRILGTPGAAGGAPAPGKRKISPAGIARIRAAAKARWARVRAGRPAAKPAKQPKRKISAAGRARLAALARARWAKAKAAGKTAL